MLELKRWLVFLLVIIPMIGLTALGFVIGLMVEMFLWGYHAAPEVLDVYDDPPKKEGA
jgi:hypothetical protein